MSKQFYFKQLSLVLSDPSTATILSQSEPGSNGNEGVLHTSQNYRITGASPSDCLAAGGIRLCEHK